jgi:hypothetical protein
LFDAAPLSSDAIFEGVSADGSGNIAVNVSSANAVSIQAVVLEAVDGGAPLTLEIAQSGGALDFVWNSLPGMQYDLVTSTDLSTPVSTWPVYDEDGPGGDDPYENIPATGTTTMLTGVLKDVPPRFFAVVETRP